MNRLFDLSVKMQISGTEDIHVVPFVDFMKEASKIDSQASTIRIGDNNYRLDNAEIGLSDEKEMTPYTAPVNAPVSEQSTETEKTPSATSTTKSDTEPFESGSCFVNSKSSEEETEKTANENTVE